MKSKHCLPIQEASMDAARKRIEMVDSQQVDLIEVWLDSIKDLRLAELFFLLEELNLPVLMVNKAPFEQGDFMGSDAERVKILLEALERGVTMVDVALETDMHAIKVLVDQKNEDQKLIISHHNFQSTPSLKTLQSKIKEAHELGADIVKLATFVTHPHENLILLNALHWSLEKGIDTIVVGMGERGKLTRIMAPLLGAKIYYAPLALEDANAPGQITKSDLENIWTTLGH